MSRTKALFTRQSSWLIPLLVACSACTGTVASDDGVAPPQTPPGGAQGGAPSSAGPSLNAGAPSAPPVMEPGAIPSVPPATERGGSKVVPSNELDSGRVVLRRLNRTEYDNTVRDLLGTLSKPARDTFAADDVGDHFDTIGNKLVMSLLLAEQVEKAAETLVDELLARPPGDAWRTRILSCEPTAASAATCYQQILSTFMRRAYRRPPTAEEVQARVALATSVQQSSGNPMIGLNAALKSILLSPHFLYRIELGDPGSSAAAPISDYELATRLSYFLWASMPDEPLLQAAEAKKLTPAGAELDAEVDRLLADPKAQGFFESFAGQWLSTRESQAFVADPAKFPGFDDELRLAMGQETNAFFKALVADKQPLSALLLADFTFLNDRLARHYGVAGGQSTFTKVSVQGSERGGILTHASFLTFTSYAFRTSPVRRADWVLEHLLCDPPPAAPPDVPALTEQTPTTGTLRQQFEQHRANPACAGCHVIMDPIGFSLEHFDATGAYRSVDNGGMVDASGVMADGTPLTSHKDLARAVASDADYAMCVAKHLLTYAVGRSFSAPEAKAYAGGVGVKVKDGTWPELLHAVIKSQAFLTRRGEAP